jgi:hypothetical protein
LSFFNQIERFKLLWNCHLKLYKSSCNSKGNKIIFKDVLRGLKIDYELFEWEFSIKTTPQLWKVVIFSFLVQFCWFLVW